MPRFLILIAASLLAAACAHRIEDNSATIVYADSQRASSFAERRTIAAETCEAQYRQGRQNYLAAVESRIGAGGEPDATRAPLDAFRAEINAAYNAVVANCKTHMNCLEVQNYEESKCYMAASDRKDAERRFADLAEDLRRLERTAKRAGAKNAGKQATAAAPVTVNNAYAPSLSQTQSQTQTNEAQTGPRIEDQDVLVMCGDAKNLLKARCRQPCNNCGD